MRSQAAVELPCASCSVDRLTVPVQVLVRVVVSPAAQRTAWPSNALLMALTLCWASSGMAGDGGTTRYDTEVLANLPPAQGLPLFLITVLNSLSSQIGVYVHPAWARDTTLEGLFSVLAAKRPALPKSVPPGAPLAVPPLVFLNKPSQCFAPTSPRAQATNEFLAAAEQVREGPFPTC